MTTLQADPNAITPDQFWKEFWKELTVVWNPDVYASELGWTRAMLGPAGHEGHDYGLLGTVGCACGIKQDCISAEYYRIDQTWYDYHDRDGHETWSLETAIEHENSGEKEHYIYEIRKLFFVRAPLRIVIGYPPARYDPLREKDSFPMTPAIRATLAAWIRDARDQGCLESPFLLVLGHRTRWQKRCWYRIRLDRENWESTLATDRLPA